MTLVEALVWIFLLPALQGPDEIGHVSYTQRLVERQSIPWQPEGGVTAEGKSPYSTELATLELWGGFSGLAGNVSARPLWTEPDERIWLREDAKLTDAARADGDFTSALKNPPAYYLYGALPYLAGSGAPLTDRIYLMRLANVPLLLAAVFFTWLIAGKLFRGRRWLQFAATAPVALQPQLLNLTGTFNPDVLLVAEYAVGLYLMLRLLERGPQRRLVLGVLAVCALAALTHYRGVPLFAPGLLAIAIAWGRTRSIAPRRIALGAAALGLLALAILVLAAGGGRGSPREFVSYVWQFYLPKLGFMTPQIGLPDYDFREVWIDRFFGTFSHLEVTLPQDVTQALFWAAVAGLVALALVLVAERRRLLARGAEVAVCAVAVVALLATLHYGAYRGMLAIPGDPVFTGRYLLPLLPLFGAAVALVASRLPRRTGPLLAAVVIGCALVLQAMSVGLLLERFYG